MTVMIMALSRHRMMDQSTGACRDASRLRFTEPMTGHRIDSEYIG